MASPSITYLLLDADNDPVLDPGSSLKNVAAVQQAILTRLRLWEGEWWEDLNLGLPVMQSILGQLGSRRGQTAINLLIIEQIKSTPYVQDVLDVSSSFADGRFSFTAQVRTTFGVLTVSTTPGDQAALDT